MVELPAMETHLGLISYLPHELRLEIISYMIDLEDIRNVHSLNIFFSWYISQGIVELSNGVGSSLYGTVEYEDIRHFKRLKICTWNILLEKIGQAINLLDREPEIIHATYWGRHATEEELERIFMGLKRCTNSLSIRFVISNISVHYAKIGKRLGVDLEVTSREALRGKEERIARKIVSLSPEILVLDGLNRDTIRRTLQLKSQLSTGRASDRKCSALPAREYVDFMEDSYYPITEDSSLVEIRARRPHDAEYLGNLVAGSDISIPEDTIRIESIKSTQEENSRKYRCRSISFCCEGGGWENFIEGLGMKECSGILHVGTIFNERIIESAIKLFPQVRTFSIGWYWGQTDEKVGIEMQSEEEREIHRERIKEAKEKLRQLRLRNPRVKIISVHSEVD